MRQVNLEQSAGAVTGPGLKAWIDCPAVTSARCSSSLQKRWMLMRRLVGSTYSRERPRSAQACPPPPRDCGASSRRAGETARRCIHRRRGPRTSRSGSVELALCSAAPALVIPRGGRVGGQKSTGGKSLPRSEMRTSRNPARRRSSIRPFMYTWCASPQQARPQARVVP